MSKKGLFLSCLLLIGLLLSCSTNDEEPEKEVDNPGFSLEFSVSSSTTKVTNDTEIKERNIKSIYVYAFDDLFPSVPDFMKDENVSDGQSGLYHLKMKIRNKVKKRFYLFVNPPVSIKRLLIPTCPEERLKSLRLSLMKPVTDVGSMPMSNYFEAYVYGESTDSHHTAQSDEVFLYPDNPVQAGKDNKITEIPVFRFLGKVTVQAYLKEGSVQRENESPVAVVPLTVTKLEVFNFNTEGNILPSWSNNGKVIDFWVPQQTPNAHYIWNENLKLDLQKMSQYEVMVENHPSDIAITRKEPISSHDKLRPDNITYCYLCQNSFGEKIQDREQDGVKDVVGNRTTKMIVTLSDGRIGEIALPYLRRNDNLKVRLAINKFKIDAEFEIWNESTVFPNWNEDISPKPIN